MKNCIVKGCDRKILVKRVRLCNLHYQRWYLYGDVGQANMFIERRNIKAENNNEYGRIYRKITGIKSINAMHKKRFGGLRKKVLKRDNYTCQICGMTNKEHKQKWNREITVDHIDGSGRYSDTHNNKGDNLWTLCLPCHGRRDFYRWWQFMGKAVPIDLIDILRLE